MYPLILLTMRCPSLLRLSINALRTNFKLRDRNKEGQRIVNKISRVHSVSADF